MNMKEAKKETPSSDAERLKDIRKLIAEGDHSAPNEIDGYAEPKAPISVRQAAFLLTIIDNLQAEVWRLNRRLTEH